MKGASEVVDWHSSAGLVWFSGAGGLGWRRLRTACFEDIGRGCGGMARGTGYRNAYT